jgi:hypothetical protein
LCLLAGLLTSCRQQAATPLQADDRGDLRREYVVLPGAASSIETRCLIGDGRLFDNPHLELAAIRLTASDARPVPAWASVAGVKIESRSYPAWVTGSDQVVIRPGYESEEEMGRLPLDRVLRLTGVVPSGPLELRQIDRHFLRVALRVDWDGQCPDDRRRGETRQVVLQTSPAPDIGLWFNAVCFPDQKLYLYMLWDDTCDRPRFPELHHW